MVPQTIVTNVDAQGVALTLALGAEVGFALAAPPKGRLNRLVVAQLTGSLDGFTATLYDNPGACPPGAGPTAVATLPEALHRIAPPLTAAGAASSAGAYGLDAHYSTGKSTAASQVVYLKVLAASSGGVGKTFGVTMVVVAPYNG